MKLVHASIAETGGAGWDGKAKAGDQTGKEVCIRAWYSAPWDIMLRYPDKTIAAKASAAAVKLAKSNLVGYDQSERNTLYKALKAVNFDIDAYIKSGKKTETDCAAFVYAIYCCFIPSMRSDSNAPTVSGMRSRYKKAGFKIYTSSSYLKGNNLLDGDIMVKESAHTAIATTGTDTASTVKYSKAVDSAITTIAKDVLKGNWATGEIRKELLYTAIQSRVNELLKK